MIETIWNSILAPLVAWFAGKYEKNRNWKNYFSFSLVVLFVIWGINCCCSCNAEKKLRAEKLTQTYDWGKKWDAERQGRIKEENEHKQTKKQLDEITKDIKVALAKKEVVEPNAEMSNKVDLLNKREKGSIRTVK